MITICNFADECLKNSDCPLTKACVAESCVDPCLTTSCGQRAECRVEQHQSRCYCPVGLQGNPLVQCIEVGCVSHDDCADNERCDYSRQSCEPLCKANKCAHGADCIAENHRESCHCRLPLKGDGYSFCTKSMISKLEMFCAFFYNIL